MQQDAQKNSSGTGETAETAPDQAETAMKAAAVEQPAPADGDPAAETPADGAETEQEKDSAMALQDLRAANADLQDRLMRALAEVENIRRRGEQERRNQARYAVAPLAQALFPVADSLSRALEAAPAVPEGEGDSRLRGFIDGVAMTARQLADAFAKADITVIRPQPGEKFDYGRHQAMTELSGTGQPPGSVAAVLQDGYMLHDRLLRPAMVGVASAAAPAEKPAAPDQAASATGSSAGQ